MQYEPMLLFQFAQGADNGLQINAKDLLELARRWGAPVVYESSNHSSMEPGRSEFLG
jgi:hypothetical protein